MGKSGLQIRAEIELDLEKRMGIRDPKETNVQRQIKLLRLDEAFYKAVGRKSKVAIQADLEKRAGVRTGDLKSIKEDENNKNSMDRLADVKQQAVERMNAFKKSLPAGYTFVKLYNERVIASDDTGLWSFPYSEDTGKITLGEPEQMTSSSTDKAVQESIERDLDVRAGNISVKEAASAKESAEINAGAKKDVKENMAAYEKELAEDAKAEGKEKGAGKDSGPGLKAIEEYRKENGIIL